MLNKVNLSRLQEKFGILVRDYLHKNNMNQLELSIKLGFPNSRLSDLLSKAAQTSQYRKPLTAYYLISFIEGGVMSADDIYDGQGDDDPREKGFWRVARVLSNTKVNELIDQILKRDYNLIPVLQGILASLEK